MVDVSGHHLNMLSIQQVDPERTMRSKMKIYLNTAATSSLIRKMSAKTLILKLMYNRPQTNEWVRWVVIDIIIGMAIHFITTWMTELQYIHACQVHTLFHCSPLPLSVCQNKTFRILDVIHQNICDIIHHEYICIQNYCTKPKR